MTSKSEHKKRIPVSKKPALQTDRTDTEFTWVQSADFFRTPPQEAGTSTESTGADQFNSEF
jgi:hypothetical protein